MGQSRHVKSRGNMERKRKEKLIFRGEIDKKEPGQDVAGLA